MIEDLKQDVVPLAVQLQTVREALVYANENLSDIDGTDEVTENAIATLDRLMAEQGVPDVSEAIHYPECWDTAAYPTVNDALSEMFSWFKCDNPDHASPPAATPVGVPDGYALVPISFLKRIHEIDGDVFDKLATLAQINLSGDVSQRKLKQLLQPIMSTVKTSYDETKAMLSTSPLAPTAADLDKTRMDWLEKQFVTVRTPLLHGSRENFMTSPDDKEDEHAINDLRKLVDKNLAAAGRIKGHSK